MLNIAGAPKRGMIYATYIDQMVFKVYNNLEELEKYLEDTNLLELHLFDGECELRFVKLRGGEIKVYQITDSGEYDDVYEESIYVLGKDIDKQENLSRKVGVVNYIRYDENDLLHIVNYRLKEIG